MSRVFTILRVHNDVLGFPELFEWALFIISWGWGQVSVNSCELLGSSQVFDQLLHIITPSTVTLSHCHTVTLVSLVDMYIVIPSLHCTAVWYFILISYLYHASRITIIDAIKYYNCCIHI